MLKSFKHRQRLCTPEMHGVEKAHIYRRSVVCLTWLGGNQVLCNMLKMPSRPHDSPVREGIYCDRGWVWIVSTCQSQNWWPWDLNPDLLQLTLKLAPPAPPFWHELCVLEAETPCQWLLNTCKAGSWKPLLPLGRPLKLPERLRCREEAGHQPPTSPPVHPEGVWREEQHSGIQSGVMSSGHISPPDMKTTPCHLILRTA